MPRPLTLSSRSRRNDVDKEALQRSMAPSPVVLPSNHRDRLKHIQTPRSLVVASNPEDRTEAGPSNVNNSRHDDSEPEERPTPRGHTIIATQASAASTATSQSFSPHGPLRMESPSAYKAAMKRHGRLSSPTDAVADVDDLLEIAQTLADVEGGRKNPNLLRRES